MHGRGTGLPLFIFALGKWASVSIAAAFFPCVPCLPWLLPAFPTMNWTHVHLALNHVPVLGSIFVALLLIAGFVKKSEELKRMSLWWFVVLTLLAIPIKFTGDFAFEANEQADWMETPMATAHEQSADQATTGVFLLGIAAGDGLFLGRKGRAMPKWVYPVALALALVTFGLMARAANLGGQIRHTEIRAD